MSNGKKKVRVRMLDSEAHRFKPGGRAVHLKKGTVVEVSVELAARWESIGRARRVRTATKAATGKRKTTTKGGDE